MSQAKFNLTPLAQKALVSAGTPVNVSLTSLVVGRVMLQASHNNTGLLYVGDSTVAAGKCIELAKGEVIIISPESNDNEVRAVVDLHDIWFDGATNGDKLNIVELPETAKSYNG